MVNKTICLLVQFLLFASFSFLYSIRSSQVFSRSRCHAPINEPSLAVFSFFLSRRV